MSLQWRREKCVLPVPLSQVPNTLDGGQGFLPASWGQGHRSPENRICIIVTIYCKLMMVSEQCYRHCPPRKREGRTAGKGGTWCLPSLFPLPRHFPFSPKMGKGMTPPCCCSVLISRVVHGERRLLLPVALPCIQASLLGG